MKIEAIIGKGVPVLGDDIDTDRIIPARFLKEISFKNMGKYAFADERFDEKGIQKHHPFNEPRFSDATILIVNKNFGCGSSREHAPQALLRYGIKAIIGESFSEIFAGNCKAIGLPVMKASEIEIVNLAKHIKQHPAATITINLASKRVRYFEETFIIDMPDPHRESFLTGTWNVVELLNQNSNKIDALANTLPYIY